MQNKKNVVEVRDVKKSFILPHHSNNSIKQAITQLFIPKKRGSETFNALDGVSFSVERGDFFGILGRNGSGKSTLLKIISEIYQPTSGSVRHNGRLVSFIELGVGFKSELSGRENVFFNGALLGFSRKEIEVMYDDIVEFAELEMFMDQKLKNYSSGMKVRLAFSLAIRSKADILILDEVLAVGDAAFKRKSAEYFESLKNDKGKTVILVTHSMSDVKRFCNKAILIEEGRIKSEGEAKQVADDYLKLFVANSQVSEEIASPKTCDVEEISMEQNGKIVERLMFMSETTLNLTVSSVESYENAVISIQIARLRRNRAVAVLSTKKDANFRLHTGLNKLSFKFNNVLLAGIYQCNVVVGIRDQDELLCQKRRQHVFVVDEVDTSRYPKTGPVFLDSEVRVLK